MEVQYLTLARLKSLSESINLLQTITPTDNVKYVIGENVNDIDIELSDKLMRLAEINKEAITLRNELLSASKMNIQKK